MGTGSSGGNATDGNDITSPRPFADDEDEIENYTYKSIYGGDGGHYKNEPAFHNPNRTKMGMFELKKYIKKYLKEQAYGHATLTTQGAPRTRAVAPAGKDPYTGRVEYPYTVGAKTKNGMMEEDESTSFKVIDVDTGKTIDFGLDKAKALEIAAFAIEDNINAEVLKMKDVNDVGNLKDEPIDPDYQGPSYDEVYLKNKLVGFKDAYEYDKGEIIIYPDLGSLQYKSRSTQEIVFKLEKGDLHFVRAFGMIRSYDELKKVLPELGQMGGSSYSGFMNVGVDDQPISLAKYGISGIEIAHDMIQALNIGREGEAAAQSKHYGAIRTPGTGGTGIEEGLNEMENAQIDRLELGANKTLAKAAVYRAENAVDAAKTQNAAGTTANAVAVDAAQKQLVDLNNQLSDVRTKHGQAKQQLQQELEIYEEIPTDEENIEEKTAAYEKLQKLKETIKTLFTQMGTLNKSVDDAKNAESKAVSATYQGKTDLAPLEKAVKDARNAVGKVGKGGGEVAETLLRQYEKERNNVNLMEQMDMYNETTRGSLQKFFEMFEAGRTTSEVIRHYAKNGIQIPEQFCSKVKKQFESYKKLKLELGFSEQEAKDFKKALDLSQKEDTKKLSTKIFKK